MSEIQRKPAQKVRSIRGGYQPDVVTQAELIQAAELQATVWLAEKNAREAVQSLEYRLRQGATMEAGEYSFDLELQMVRSNKRATG